VDTNERLEELLAAKDARIQRLENEFDKARDEQERFENWLEYKWTKHQSFDSDPYGLPVPRLQIECTSTDEEWHDRTWRYDLVYRHFLGSIEFIPLGLTISRGGRGKPELVNVLHDLPFRDGSHIVHDSAVMKLPAYAIVERKTVLIEPKKKFPDAT